MYRQRSLMYLPILVCFLLLNAQITTGWFFSSDSSEERENLKTEQAPMPEKQVPFEMQTADDKFLLQAKFTAELSPLDLCHHMVVGEITGTCSDLSEEELNKLAVMLLNCQSESEHRPTFPCTLDMSIAECTRDMDATTWNAYQIVANRARAICYSTRQQHFRMKTEHTVNQLVMNTQQQAQTVKEIQAQQEAVSEAAQDTLRQVNEGQQQLQTQQQQTAQTQQRLHTNLALNLRELAREKALIAAGHSEIAHMTQDIRKKLDETSEKLDIQAQKHEENHQHIAADLTDIQNKATDVFNKIDESSKNVVDLQHESEKHYRHTLDNLEKVNNTINYALGTLEEFKLSVEKKLNWLMSLVGGTGDRMDRLMTVVLHVAYLLLAVISASFLRTPVFSRLVLLLIVPINAWSELQHRQSLSFLPMTLFILLTVIANWVAGWLMYLMSSHKPSPPMLEPSPPSPPVCEPQEDAAHTCTCANNNTNPAESTKAGLSTPDVHRLIETLEKLYEAGALSPPGPRKTTPPEPTNPVNTPATQRPYASYRLEGATGCGDNSYSLTKSQLSREHDLMRTDERARLDPEPYRDPQRVNLVRRHLLKSVLATPPGSGSRSPASTALGSPGDSPVSTPPHTPNTTPPGSPAHSTPLKSFTPSHVLNLSRPQCLAVTRAGMPCKNSCMEGSGFCHCHQTTPSKGTPKGTPRNKGLSAKKGTPVVSKKKVEVKMEAEEEDEEVHVEKISD